MFFPFFFTALLTLFSGPLACSGFSVQTPNFTQCAQVNLSWDNTTGPYDILIANQSNQCGYAVGDLGQFTNNYATWTVSIPAGWTVVISVEDDLYDEAWSQPILVQPSGNTSCLTPDLAALPNAKATPTSTQSGRASASAKSSKSDASRQIPSSVFLLSTIGFMTCAFFAL